MTDTHKTLIQFLIEDQQRHGSDERLTMLLHDVTTACKAISNALKNGASGDVVGSAGTENVQGETKRNSTCSRTTCSCDAASSAALTWRWCQKRWTRSTDPCAFSARQLYASL